MTILKKAKLPHKKAYMIRYKKIHLYFRRG
jgi:hypothetical protein